MPESTELTYMQLLQKYGTDRDVAMAYLQGKMPPEDEVAVRLKCSKRMIMLYASEYLSRTMDRFLDAVHKLTV